MNGIKLGLVRGRIELRHMFTTPSELLQLFLPMVVFMAVIAFLRYVPVGGSTQEQYLYCASNTHQLVGLYPTTSGATCSNYSTKTADYSIGSYDGFGNVASRTVCSKKTFAEALAKAMGRKLTRAQTGSVRQLQPARAESLGLDVSRAESVLGRRLPDLEQVVSKLARSRKDAL